MPSPTDDRIAAFQWSPWLGAAIVFAAIFITFSPAMQHDFVDWDDTDNFVRNNNFRGLKWDHIQWMFTTFHMGHYQPLSWLSLGFDCVWGGIVFGEHPEYGWGMDPRSFHITNVVLHAMNAVLVFLIALRLIGGPAAPRAADGGPMVIAAVVAGLIFGVHPLRVESVAWATERRDLLSGFFLLLTVLAYLRAHHPGGPRRFLWMAIALALFAMSLLSKVIGVTLPLALLALDWHPLRRLGYSPREWFVPASRIVWLEKIPFFALSIVFSLIASIGQGTNRWLVTLDMHPLAARVVQSLYGLVFYVWKTLLPFDLLPLYEMRFPLPIVQPRFILAGLLVALASGFLIFCFVKRRCGALIVAAFVYALMLSPVLGLMQNGPQIVADRYSYLPCIGWAMLGGGAIGRLWPARRALRAMTLTAAFVAVAALALLAWRQTFVWRNTASLWTYTALNDPNNSRAQNGYGFVLLQQGRLDEAIRHLRRSIELIPENDKAHYNLWNALLKQGDRHALLAAYEAGTTIPPVAAAAHYELGSAMLSDGRLAEAESHFESALAADPLHTRARTNLGITLVRQGRRDEGIQEYRRTIQIDPTLFHAHYNLGLSLRTNGNITEALVHLRAATHLNPQHEGARRALEELLKAADTKGS